MFGCCDRHQLDQTSTPGVEDWSKFRPNFGTPSIVVWSKFGRSLVAVWSKFGRSLVSQFGKQFIKFTMHFIDISSKLRPNFDTGGVEAWSKFGRSLVEVWSKFQYLGCRSFIEISSKPRHWEVEVWSNFRPNFNTHIFQNRLFH